MAEPLQDIPQRGFFAPEGDIMSHSVNFECVHIKRPPRGDKEGTMSSDSNDREAKAFAWRAIGCAAWLGIGIVILLVAGSFLSVFLR